MPPAVVRRWYHRPQAIIRHLIGKPTVRCCLEVELLEDRTVPTVLEIAPTDQLASHFQPNHHWLTNASGGFLTGPNVGQPLDIALGYLNSHATDLGLTASDLAQLIVTDMYADADVGVTHIYLRQAANGLQVENANFSIHIASQGEVITVGGGFVANLSGLVGTTIAPDITAQQALLYAASHLGLDGTGLSELQAIGGVDQRYVYAAPGVSTDAIPVHLQYMATPDGGAALVWQMIVQTPDGDHWYDVSIDAGTGALMGASDWGKHAAYNVYARPTESPGDGPRTLVTDPWLVAGVASPFGWHDTNGVAGAESTQTVGNNVDAHADHDGVNGTLDVPRPDGGAGLNFNFPINLAGSPLTYTNASVVNLFYLSNISHDLHYLYGFNEAAGNFQTNNYSRGGAQGDAVQADAQDGSDLDNADFFTPPDGTAPRMQMYLFTTATPLRDGSLDSGIVLHEYGHGVSDRLTGGPANSNALQTYQSAGMGEGWSDWWALMFLQKPGDSASAGYTIGSYAVNDPLGARRFPYSANPAINNQTFDIYNQNSDNGSTREVHNTGEIWAGVLWDLNWLMIDRYGYEDNLYDSLAVDGVQEGNIKALHLVTQALKLQPANPSFTEARDAILAADTVLYAGANHDLIWEAFARRGLGYSAYTSDSDAMGVTVAFDTPFTRITGQKYNDIDGDAVKDAGESGLSGWQVYLDINGNNAFDATINNLATFNYTGPAVAIPDNATFSGPGTPVSANISVSGLGGLIKEVRVALADGNSGTVDLQHPFLGDLEIELISPSGTIVPLVSALDYSTYSGVNFVETFFADAFGTSINSGAAPFTGNFKPEGRLAAFNGENPNGVWQLRLQDQASVDAGVLNRWRLIITTGEPTTTTDATGNYQFIVKPSTYTVREVGQSGWSQSAPVSGEHTVTVALGVPQTNIDFGNHRGIISGTKYTDITGNGPGGGDTPLAGVTINLYRDTGNGVLNVGVDVLVGTTTTNAVGAYIFTDLAPGTYFVQEVVPSGYVPTSPVTPAYHTVAVAGGNIFSGRDFYNFQQMSIGGTKYIDQNGDGSVVGDTPYLAAPGVAINLYRDGNSNGTFELGPDTLVTSTTTSTVDGSYSFPNLGPGTYFVTETAPAGYVQTTPATYHTIIANSGVNVANAHFGNFQLVSIGGTKYTDRTGDGITGDDTPLDGVTIKLFRDVNNSGTLDAADGAAVASQVTAGGGLYSFANVGPGRYFVQEVVPPGYVRTAPGAPGYYTIVTSSGVNSTNNNFANFQTITISGAKFIDNTADGLTADDTTPLNGVTINLFRDGNNNTVLDAGDGPAVQTAATAGAGAYTFSNVGPGRYFVQEVVPAGYAQTTPTGPNYYTVNAVSGTNVGGRNFSNFLGGVFSGAKFTDVTSNGWTGDDTPLAGVTINLFRDTAADGVLTAADGAAIASQNTAAGTGAYSFAGLLPGTYFVQEVVPTGYLRTTPVSPDYYTFTVATSGQTSANNNFANFQLATISGVKFTDVSGNGLTGDDTPLAGVTINLFRDDGDGVRDVGDSLVTFAVSAAGTGAYSFTGLTVGRYFVEEVVPAGYGQTGPAAGYHTVDVATSGFNSTGNHFANFQLATISGASLTDLTGNGPTGDDTPLGTVVINLFRDVNNNNALDAADGAAIASTTTAAGTGAYTFTGLGVGRYFVQEVVPTGATLTNPAPPGYHTVNVSLSGLNATARNFYNFQGNFIQGRLYNDLNQDGTDNGGADPGLGGVVISLYRESNSTPGLQATDTLVTTTTSVPGTGAYRLAAPGTGTFYVSETLPVGFSQTAPIAPLYHTVPSGGPYTAYDFGNYPLTNNDGIGFYDRTTATWYLRNTTTAGPPDFTPFVFGTVTTGLPRHGPPVAVGGSLPVVGDWDGDGDTTIGAYDPATSQWYLRNSNSAGAVDVPVFTFGSAGMIPVVGDWDGDGTSTVGVYDPRTATWYLNNSNAAGPASIAPFVFGFAGAIPVVGDWDGNGTDTVGVYDPATAAWHLRNSNDAGPASVPIFSFGFGSKPVVGDWNHDGRDTIGVWDPNTGNWYLRDSNDAGAVTVPVFAYGSGSYPVVGDWDYPLTPLSTVSEFTPWASLNGFVKQIAVATNGAGQLQVFAIGGDNALWYRTQAATNAPTDFGPWTSMGGFVKQFTIGHNADGTVQVFAIGGDNAAWTNLEVGGVFTSAGWRSLGGFVKQLAVSRDGADRLELFGIGGDNALWRNVQVVGTTFTGWTSLGGYVTQVVSAVNADATVQVFVIGGDHALWTNKQTAAGLGGFNGWQSLGGYVLDVAVGVNQDLSLQVFALGGDHAVWTRKQNPAGSDTTAGFTPWASLGGFAWEVDVARHSDGTLQAFVIGGDHAVYGRRQTSPGASLAAGFAPYVHLGGFVKQLTVGVNGDTQAVQFFGIGGDNALWTRGETVVGPLVAAGGAGSGAPAIADADLAPLIDEAIRRWGVAGVGADLRAWLRALDYRVVNLPGAYLGFAQPGAIVIDADAAGHGWFLDPTPALDEEFDSAGDSPMTQMDLLTAIMHEMGHALGFDHGAAGLMFEALASGRRQSCDS